MKIFSFTMDYVDRREILIEAVGLEEARAKMDSGDFLSENTVDFYADHLVEPLTLIKE